MIPDRRPKVLVNLSMTADGKFLSSNESKGRSFQGGEGVVVEINHFKSLLESDAVDELCLTILPVIRGGAKEPSLSGLSGEFLPEERRFRLKSLVQLEEGVLLHYLRDRKKSTGKKKK